MDILFYIVIGTLLLIILIALITVVLKKYKKYCEERLNNVQVIFLGKLSDNQEDDINQAMKYLKLTNSIEKTKSLN